MGRKKSFKNPHIWRGFLAAIFIILAAGIQASFQTKNVLAATNTLQINVISARSESRAFGGNGVIKGDPISEFKYIINIDNTGTTDQTIDPITGERPPECTPEDPGYPDS